MQGREAKEARAEEKKKAKLQALDDSSGFLRVFRMLAAARKPIVGHKVSHSNVKTKRRFLPNLNDVTLQSETLGRGVKLRISAAALRSVDHRGGLDAFLAKAKDEELSANALKVKKAIAKAQASA